MAKGSTVGSAEEGGADFRGNGEEGGDFSLGYIFLWLLVTSVEFEV